MEDLTEYEKERRRRINRNQAQLIALGLAKPSTLEIAEVERFKGANKKRLAEVEFDDDDNGEASPTCKRRKRRRIDSTKIQTVCRRSPRLRGQLDHEGFQNMLQVLKEVEEELLVEKSALEEFMLQARARLREVEDLHGLFV
eukprot:TRINITY_DN8543_c0_g1_i14.p1 TRINITY_DN8543_c0_g1~~TRINITY_DN8543_c0_g1_i14.p1  ORF type:complete len:142 (-),score=35.70 TRINITY_DN8543_c0_g1_i14:40-465(-)